MAFWKALDFIWHYLPCGVIEHGFLEKKFDGFARSIECGDFRHIWWPGRYQKSAANAAGYLRQLHKQQDMVTWLQTQLQVVDQLTNLWGIILYQWARKKMSLLVVDHPFPDWKNTYSPGILEYVSPTCGQGRMLRGRAIFPSIDLAGFCCELASP